MSQPAAKRGDKVVSDGTSQIWVQPRGTSTHIPVTFSYEGNLADQLSEDVLIEDKPAATVGSTAQNAKPPGEQPNVTGQGSPVTLKVDNTGTVATGSSSVFINGKAAARHTDLARTWDYGTPPQPGKAMEKENAKVEASSSVWLGD